MELKVMEKEKMMLTNQNFIKMDNFNLKKYLADNKLVKENRKEFLLNHESIKAFGILRNAVDQIVKSKGDEGDLKEYQVVKDELEGSLDRYFDFIVKLDEKYPD